MCVFVGDDKYLRENNGTKKYVIHYLTVLSLPKWYETSINQPSSNVFTHPFYRQLADGKDMPLLNA